MKILKIIALGACALLFSHCKSTSPSGPTGPAPSLLEVHQILDSAENKFIAFANQTNGDPWQAIELTTAWLLNQSNVKNAYYLDSTYITIQLNSGLETGLYLDLLNDSGYSIFRGGGSISKEKPASADIETLSENKITNKKVLIFAADTKTLGAVKPQIGRTVGRLANSGLGLDVTVLQDEQCSYGVVEHFGDYGLVIMDTHGTDNSFLVGSTLDLSSNPKSDDALKALLNVQAGAGTSDKIAAGSLKLVSTVKANINTKNWQKSLVPQSGRELYFTSKYLDLLPAMPNTIILGNMCYSGSSATTYIPPVWRIDTIFEHGGSSGKIVKIIQRGGTPVTVDNPIRPAFSRKNLISYYGYIRDNPAGSSRPVPDDFAAEMEDSLIKRFVENLDSTKITNLKRDNSSEYFDPPHIDPSIRPNLQGELYFRHFGAEDYSYEKGCVDSFIDARDGHRYKAFCINGQNWMAENLDYNAAGSFCYDNNNGNCDTYGRLYDWKTLMQGADSSSKSPSGVQGVCPKGWHIPSYDEVTKLIFFVGGKSGKAGSEMRAATTWANNGGGTNSSGFSALAAGDYALSPTLTFENLGINTYFWTTTTLDIYNKKGFFVIFGGQEPVLWGSEDPALGLSCRCLKD